jgi:hypothetical protein
MKAKAKKPRFGAQLMCAEKHRSVVALSIEKSRLFDHFYYHCSSFAGAIPWSILRPVNFRTRATWVVPQCIIDPSWYLPQPVRSHFVESYPIALTYYGPAVNPAR